MIDLAKTSRAKCRTCKQTIDKDTLRFGELDFTFSSSGSYRWHHLHCAMDRMGHAVEAWIRANPHDLPMPLPELRAAMDPTAVDEEAPGAELPDTDLPEPLRQRMGKAPKLPRWLDVDRLPRLRLPDGRGLPRDAQAHLLDACKGPPSRLKDVAVVDAVVDLFGEASFTELAVVVFERWADRGTMRDDWVLRLLDRCDDRIVEPVGKACAQWMRKGGTGNDKARRVLDVLAKTDRDTALLEVQQLAQRYAYKGSANAAQHALAASAA